MDLSRPEPVQVSDPSDPATRPVSSVVYDNVGRRTDMADGTGTSQWRFDSLGRLTSFTDGANKAMGYGYANTRDPATTVTYPGNRPVTRGFDDAGRMVAVKDWLGNLTTITPDADANVATITPPAATNTLDTFGYDPADAASSAKTTVGTTTAFGATYGRDNADQVKSTTDPVPTIWRVTCDIELTCFHLDPDWQS